MANENKFWRNVYVLLIVFVLSIYFALFSIRTSLIGKLFPEDMENMDSFYAKWKQVSLLLMLYMLFVILYHIAVFIGIFILIWLYLYLIKDDKLATDHTKTLLSDIFIDKMSSYYIVWSVALFFFFVFFVLYFRFNKSFIDGLTFQDFIKAESDEEKEEHTTPKKLLMYYSWYVVMLLLFMLLLMSINFLFGKKNNILIYNVICMLLYIMFVSMLFLFLLRKRGRHTIFLGLLFLITLMSWKLLMKF